MDQSVLDNGITAPLLQPTAVLPNGQCHIVFREKSSHAKFFDHFFIMSSE